MNANLSRLKLHPFHFYGDPRSWFVSIYHTFLTLRATPLLCFKYTPTLSLGSTSNLPRDIYASQNVLPESRVNRYWFYDRNLFDLRCTSADVITEISIT